MINGKKGKYLALLLILLAGAILSLALFSLSYHWEQGKISNNFSDLASDRAKIIENSIRDDLNALRSVGDLFAASQKVERDEFRIFTQAILAKYPSILEFRWLERVSNLRRQEFEEAIRQQGLVNFQIKEVDEGERFVPAGPRQEYLVVTYLESSKVHIIDHSSIFGLDVAIFPERKVAQEKARDTARITSTGEVKYVGETGIEIDTATRVYLPIYRNDAPHNTPQERRDNLTGFVAMIYRIDDMVKGALEGISPSGVDIYLYEENDKNEKIFLYFRPSITHKESVSPTTDYAQLKKNNTYLFWDKVISGVDRPWHIVCVPAPLFLASHRIINAWGLLIIGLISTLSLTIYLRNVIRRTAIIESLVQERTIELSASREKLKRTAEEWENTFNAITDMIAIQDSDCNLLRVNRAYAGALNTVPEAVIGKKCYNLIHGTEEPCRDCPYQRSMATGRPEVSEIFEPRFGAYFEVSASPIFDNQGRQIGCVHIMKDITRRKKLEQVKTEFVSTVSHELRTPLAITKEGISLILDKIPGQINEKQQKILITAMGNIDRLARIINNLLDISKIEGGAIEIKKEPVELGALIRQVASSFEPRIKEKGLGLRISLPPEKINIYADNDRLIQVLTNLLGNAVKFTDVGYIEISAKESDNEIECAVADSGIGIAEEDLPKVFTKFQQFGRLPGAGEKGTGLGLSIAKGIIDMHKGRIWVESNLGKGSRFIFALPKHKAEDDIRDYINRQLKSAGKSGYRVSFINVSLPDYAGIEQGFGQEKARAISGGIGALLKKNLRRKDDAVMPYRSGFIILLVDCDKKDVLAVVDRFKEAVKDYLNQEGLGEGRIKAEFSSLTYPEELISANELLAEIRGW